MDRKWIISMVIVIILGLILGIVFAIFSDNMKKTEDTNVVSEKELANSNEINKIKEGNSIETSSNDERISPNAIIIKKTYYKSCDHLIRKVEEIPKNLVNKTKSEVENKYSDWELESFSNTQIVLYKNLNKNCGEHYFVQEHNGVIGIYMTDEYGIKTLKEDTEISTQYLPDTDVQRLKAGVEIIGYTKLMEFLEDFE